MLQYGSCIKSVALMACLALVCLMLLRILERTASGAQTNSQSWAYYVESALHEQLGVRPQSTLLVALADTHEDKDPPSLLATFPYQTHLFLRELQESKLRAMLFVSGSLRRLPEEHHQHSLRVDVVLLVLGEDPQTELHLTLQLLEVNASWNPRLPHLVVLQNPRGADNIEDATALLSALWERKATRAILIRNVSSEFEILKWSPLGFGKDCNGPTSSSVARIRHALSETNDTTFQPIPSLHALSFNFFSGCILRASTWEFPPYTIKRQKNESETGPLYQDGLDVRIVQEIAMRMKMNVDFGNRELLYVPTGELVANGSADLTVGAFVMMPQFYPSMDPSITYWNELAVWIVPGGAPIPRWLSIIVVFSLEMWIFLLVSYVLMVGMFALLKKVGRNKSLNAFDIFRLLLGDSIITFPGGSLGCSLFLVWVVSDIVLSSAYQSALVSFLTNPGIYDAVTSEEELIESGLKIGLFGDYRYIFEGIGDENFKLFLERSWDCLDAHSCLDSVAHFRDSAMPYDLSYVEYQYDGDGREKIKVMGTITTYSIMMFVTKGSALLEMLNCYLFGLVEGSLVNLWWKQITSKSGPLGVNPVHRHLTPPVKISLTHLQGVFFLWVVGTICSCVVFCAEVGSTWLTLKNSRRFKMFVKD